MDIKIGKADIVQPDCEGCKKKFICNLANNNATSRGVIETKLGIEIPKQYALAIMDDPGREDEKGTMLYILGQGKSISSMTDGVSFTYTYGGTALLSPYVVFKLIGIMNLENELSEKIAKVQYLMDGQAECN